MERRNDEMGTVGMKRVGLLLVAVMLVVAACGSGDAEDVSTTASTTTTSTTPATTSTTTTSTTTTTIPPKPVTEGPGLPSTEHRDAVPWEQVDGAWTLALVSGDPLEGTVEPGPRVLYLIDGTGARFEIRAWEWGPSVPWFIHDWSPDGRRALVGFAGSDGHNEIRMVTLEDGSEAPIMPPTELGDSRAGFTKPTGRDLVLWTTDGITERLEVVRADLSPFSTLAEQPHDHAAPLTWLFGPEGTIVVIGDSAGLHVYGNDGEFLTDLASLGAGCRPLKWWQEDLILASCIPADWAAADSFFHQLWLVPLDGSNPLPVTSVPAEMPDVVDFGYTDAWRAGDEVFLQWAGDCAAARVDRLLGGGPLLDDGAGPHRVIGTIDSDAVLHTWDGCDQSESALLRVAVDGTVVAELIPRVEGVVGVLSAVSLPHVP